MASSQIIRAADLFCGAGGTTTGMIKAVKEMGYDIDLLAINHWDIAIATHSLNYPERGRWSVKHKCQNLDKVDPAELITGGRLDLLVASPECKDHSNAKGGMPLSDQKRADAWLLMRWIEKLYVKNLLIENVREFVNWGPLGANGRPLKSRRGEYFRAFIRTLEINYNVEWKFINCADHGDPTTRIRFFLMARRKGHPHFAWPEQTHASPKEIAKRKVQPQLFATNTTKLKPWVPARKIIDWKLPSKSIFGRKKPLSPNTLARIFAGLRKHSGLALIMATGGNEGQMHPRPVSDPVRTVMPNSRLNLVEAQPFVIKTSHKGANGNYVRSIDEPLLTLTGQLEHGVVEPCIVNMKGQSDARSIDDPTFTQTTKNHQYLLEPVLINHKGKKGRSRSVKLPSFTQCAGGNHQGIAEGNAIALQPFIAPVNHGGGADGERRHHSVDAPMPSVTSVDAWSLIEPYLIGYFEKEGRPITRTPKVRNSKLHAVPGQQPIIERGKVVKGESFLVKSYKGSDSASLDAPTPSITANFEHLGLAEPFLSKFYGTSESGQAVTEPLGTVTGKDRFALVEPYVAQWAGAEGQDCYGLVIPQLGLIIDIRFRMLQPHELAAAQSFPKNYKFAGNRENKVMQIGNAVPCRTAKALCKALLTSSVRVTKPRAKARKLKRAA